MQRRIRFQMQWERASPAMREIYEGQDGDDVQVVKKQSTEGNQKEARMECWSESQNEARMACWSEAQKKAYKAYG